MNEKRGKKNDDRLQQSSIDHTEGASPTGAAGFRGVLLKVSLSASSGVVLDAA